MQEIREAVFNCLDRYENDELLIPALNEIIEERGKAAYPIILHILTHILLEQEQAEQSWNEIIRLYHEMAGKLGRKVSIRTAICDYFCSVNKALKTPKSWRFTSLKKPSRTAGTTD